jgi:hypothetical protein
MRMMMSDLYIYFSDGGTIPGFLQSVNWDYDFNSTNATLNFTSSGMTGLKFTAGGDVLNTYDCIAKGVYSSPII